MKKNNHKPIKQHQNIVKKKSQINRKYKGYAAIRWPCQRRNSSLVRIILMLQSKWLDIPQFYIFSGRRQAWRTYSSHNDKLIDFLKIHPE